MKLSSAKTRYHETEWAELYLGDVKYTRKDSIHMLISCLSSNVFSSIVE